MKKSIKIRYLFIAVFLGITQFVYPQNDTVVGVLMDVNSKVVKQHPVTLGSVSPVTVKTDKNGSFTFTNVNLRDTLFVGNKKGKNAVAIPIDGHNFLTLRLRNGIFNSVHYDEDEERIRYFRQLQIQNSKVSNSRTVRKEDIDDSKCRDIECLVEMRTGATVVGGLVYTGGRVGNSSSLIGGAGSSTIDPLLIILDGVDVGSALGNVNHINPANVESISISRDGARYGSRGRGGLLIINTVK